MAELMRSRRKCEIAWCIAQAKPRKKRCAVHERDETIHPQVPEADERLVEDGTTCDECKGAGEIECPTCDGDGTHRCGDSYCDDEHDCGRCDGTGKLLCEDCDGSGIEGTYPLDDDGRRPVPMWKQRPGGGPWDRRYEGSH